MSEPAPPFPHVPVQAIEYQAFNQQTAADLSHLQLLVILHYIYGGLTMLISSIFIFHIVFGVMMLNNPNMLTANTPGPAPAPPPPFFGWMMIIGGSVAVGLGWTLGILTMISARSISRRKRRTF